MNTPEADLLVDCLEVIVKLVNKVLLPVERGDCSNVTHSFLCHLHHRGKVNTSKPPAVRETPGSYLTLPPSSTPSLSLTE